MYIRADRIVIFRVPNPHPRYITGYSWVAGRMAQILKISEGGVEPPLPFGYTIIYLASVVESK